MQNTNDVPLNTVPLNTVPSKTVSLDTIPANMIDDLRSAVTDARAAGVFSQRQANSLNRKLNRAGRLIEDGRYWLAALHLDLFATQGLLITAPGEWVTEPNIAFDMGQTLRGWVVNPD